MHRHERHPAAKRKGRLDGDAVERHVEIGARKAVAMDVAATRPAVLPSAASTFCQSISCALGGARQRETATAGNRRRETHTHFFLLVFWAHCPVEPAPATRTPQNVVRIAPTNGVHEDIDVVCRLGAEIHVIGVLVHIEREDRDAAGQRVAVIGRPLIDEFAVARRPESKHPAGAAAERLAHGDEFGAPTLKGAEIARERVAQGRPGSLWSPVRRRTARAGSSSS